MLSLTLQKTVFLSSQLLCDDGEHGKTGEFLEQGPLQLFSRGKVSFLIGSNAVWNSMAMDKTFCMSLNDSFGILAKKASLYLSKCLCQ